MLSVRQRAGTAKQIGSLCRLAGRAIGSVVLGLIVLPLARARERAQGFCEDGGQTVTIPGTQGSTTSWQRSFPSCVVKVHIAGHETASIASATRSLNVVTVTTVSSHGFVAGGSAIVTGVADASFNGSFSVTSVPNPMTFTYNQTGSNASSTGGSVEFLPSLYSDNAGTVQGNPFTAASDGRWFFYADDGRYDLTFSGGGISVPYTVGDVPVREGSGFTYQGVAFNPTPSFDFSAAQAFAMNLTGNVTSSTVTNPVTGGVAAFVICQDATGGRTFVWPAAFADPPAIASGPSECTNASFIYDGTSWRPLAAPGDRLGSIVLSGGATISGSTGGSLTVTPAASGNFTLASGSIVMPGGGSIQAASGGISVVASGTNQSVTLTPSGTGTVSVGGNLTTSKSAIFGGTATLQVSGGPEDISFQNAAANHVIMGGWVTGDTNARWLNSINGFMEWGEGGTSDQSVALFHNWTGGLQIQSFNGTNSDHAFSVHQATTNGLVGLPYFRVDESGTNTLVDIENGARLAVNGAAGGAPVDVVGLSGGNGVRVQAAASDLAYSAFVSGDNFARFNLFGSGTITLGGGTASTDVTLSRPFAGQFNVTGSSGLGVLQPGDNDPRILLDTANNRISLGPGNAAVDTTLTRVAPGEIALAPVSFANLGAPINGTICFCSDCTVANPCAGGGTGALAKRLNGAWVCN